MEKNIFNPWHGCHKISEGCLHCYVYRRDQSIGKDASVVSKTSSFNYPIAKNKNGQYKCTEKLLYCCMTSDFFLEEADQWRQEVWAMIKERNDITFFIITKRIHRFYQCLPQDWNDGYDNVHICCTIENQHQCDQRLDYFLSLPILHKHIICEPLLSDIDFSKKLNGIESITAGGESGDDARLCKYDWILHIRQQAIEQNVSFHFKQTGQYFEKDHVQYHISRSLQLTQAKKANIGFTASEKKN